jgi:hypothetical protein
VLILFKILVQDKERWSQCATSHPHRPAVPSVQGFTIGGQKIKIETNRWSSNRVMPNFQALLGGQESGQEQKSQIGGDIFEPITEYIQKQNCSMALSCDDGSHGYHARKR